MILASLDEKSDTDYGEHKLRKAQVGSSHPIFLSTHEIIGVSTNSTTHHRTDNQHDAQITTLIDSTLSQSSVPDTKVASARRSPTIDLLKYDHGNDAFPL